MNHEGHESHEVEQGESVNEILKKVVDGRIRPLYSVPCIPSPVFRPLYSVPCIPSPVQAEDAEKLTEGPLP
jgi:hypothetical protein